MLVSMGRMEFNFANGASAGTISLGLTYFNWTICVTYWPRSGNSEASRRSRGAPSGFTCACGRNLKDLSRGKAAASEVGKALGCEMVTLDRLSGLVGAWEWKDPSDTPER